MLAIVHAAPTRLLIKGIQGLSRSSTPPHVSTYTAPTDPSGLTSTPTPVFAEPVPPVSSGTKARHVVFVVIGGFLLLGSLVNVMTYVSR